jgi:hypothetical protein
MREVSLPSGAVLKVNVATFAASKALYQALLRELRTIPIAGGSEAASLLKDLFCAGFSSPDVEAALKECFKRCLYKSSSGTEGKVEDSTFESEVNRQDYTTVCAEVARDNVAPFLSSLYAEFQKYMVKMEKAPA